jgi:hypothetical protein
VAQRQDPGGPALTAPQRRALLVSDPATGEVRAPRAVRAALVSRGLAVVHGARGAVYLSPAGRAARDRLGAEASGPADGTSPGTAHPVSPAATGAPGTAPAGTPTTAPAAAPMGQHAPAAAPGPGAPPGRFEPAYGDETAAGVPDADAGGRHAAHGDRSTEVAGAWAGVLEIRRVSGAGEAPARWERERGTWAVALALEAAGVPASAVDRSGRRVRGGYRVGEGPEPGTVRVEWRGPATAPAGPETEAALARCAALLAERGWSALAYLGPGRHRYLLVTPVDAAGRSR